MSIHLQGNKETCKIKDVNFLKQSPPDSYRRKAEYDVFWGTEDGKTWSYLPLIISSRCFWEVCAPDSLQELFSLGWRRRRGIIPYYRGASWRRLGGLAWLRSSYVEFLKSWQPATFLRSYLLHPSLTHSLTHLTWKPWRCSSG